VGETGHSPLIQLPDGVVVHAQQIANDSGQADKVIRIDHKKDRHLRRNDRLLRRNSGSLRILRFLEPSRGCD
jgi:hypothetical protein